MSAKLLNDVQRQEPDLPSALFLAGVCGQTYTQFNNHKSGLFLVPQGYKLLGEIRAEGNAFYGDINTFGFCIVSEGCAILAFRGSSTTMDWVADFTAQQMNYPYVKNAGLTHKGFTDIYISLRNSIDQLLSVMPQDLPLFITGHSLGGALATLAALDIASNSNIADPTVYTFGAPRVGDPGFVKTYNYTVPTHWRIQNKYDIVPHLPTLVYHSPQTDENYFYLHVKGEVMRSFRYGSVASNHVVSSYFSNLAADLPEIADQICENPPGWCPAEIAL